MRLSLEEFLEDDASGSSAVARQTQVRGASLCCKTLPLSHSLDDTVVTMNASVDSLLPLAIDRASVPTSVRVVSLGVLHGLVAGSALSADTGRAV
jgi:hypothetical protein